MFNKIEKAITLIVCFRVASCNSIVFLKSKKINIINTEFDFYEEMLTN